ncbi:MAG: transposase, partial [Planktotalea arctica]
QVARDIAKTKQYVISMRLRKKVEMFFAPFRRIRGLGRLRLRGPCGANDEFHLAAPAQNLRKLAKHCPSGYWQRQCTRGVFPELQQTRKA